MPARTRPFEEFLLSSMISASVRRTPCQGNAKRFPGGRRGCRTDQAGLPKCQESQPAMEGPEPASGPVACRRCPRGASCSSCQSRHQSDMSDAGWVVIEPTLPSRMEAGQGRPAEHCHLAASRKPDRLLRSSTFSRVKAAETVGNLCRSAGGSAPVPALFNTGACPDRSRKAPHACLAGRPLTSTLKVATGIRR